MESRGVREVVRYSRRDVLYMQMPEVIMLPMTYGPKDIKINVSYIYGYFVLGNLGYPV